MEARVARGTKAGRTLSEDGMERYLSDARTSLRIFRRSPALALGAVLALAMGIGLTTTMYSIVRGGTRPLPFESPEELVALTHTSLRYGYDIPSTEFDFVTWSRGLRSYEGLAAFADRGVNVGGEARRPERRQASEITPNAFALVGVSAALGRVFDENDARSGATAVVLLGHDLWQSRFGGDSGIIGRTMRLDGTVHTIIGVMPAGFAFPIRSSLWLPLTLPAAPEPRSSEGSLVVLGRLRDGVSAEQARAELTLLTAGIARDYPATHEGLASRILPFVELEMSPETPAILSLMLACVMFVLLIACANVANLLIARAATRSRELAIRAALGATRGRLVALQVAESIALAAVGGALGFWMASLAVPAFASATSDVIDAFWIDFRVDGAVALFATATVAMAGVLAGLAPGLRASRAHVADALRDASSQSTGLQLGRMARALVVAEVALATGLLIMTMTLTQTAVALRAVPMPFDAHRILAGQLALTTDVVGDAEARRRLTSELERRVAGAPGAQALGFASALPGRGAGSQDFTVDARREDGSTAATTSAGFVIVTPGFFAVLGARPRSGRLLTEADGAGAPTVAVVNESWVARYSADRDPLGRRLWIGDRALDIVGVVPDLQMQDLEDRDGAGIYASMWQFRPYVVRFLVRTAGDPLAFAPTVRDAAEAVDPDLPIFEMGTLHDLIFADKQVLDAFATLFAIAGVGALFLTMLGVYGIVSFAVTSRTREIGVRVALGASRGAILRLVVRQGAWLVGIGTAIGLVIAFAISQALAAVQDFFQPAAPATYLMIVSVLLLTAAAALVRPASRALRLDPVEALRDW